MSDYDWKNHRHKTNRGGVRRVYSMPYLWEKAKDLPVREINPEDIPKDLPEFEYLMGCEASLIWGSRRRCVEERSFLMQDFFDNACRIRDADLSYPIILNPLGGMMDGMHRMMKAMLEGKKLLVVQFEEWPEPDLE